jgi:hypothetical protein
MLSSPDATIPFCQYIELGVNACAAAKRRAYPALADKSLQEIVESRNFQYKEVSLTIKVTQTDINGFEFGGHDEVTKNIQ